jgi:hypothetical protein
VLTCSTGAGLGGTPGHFADRSGGRRFRFGGDQHRRSCRRIPDRWTAVTGRRTRAHQQLPIVLPIQARVVQRLTAPTADGFAFGRDESTRGRTTPSSEVSGGRARPSPPQRQAARITFGRLAEDCTTIIRFPMRFGGEADRLQNDEGGGVCPYGLGSSASRIPMRGHYAPGWFATPSELPGAMRAANCGRRADSTEPGGNHVRLTRPAPLRNLRLMSFSNRPERMR